MNEHEARSLRPLLLVNTSGQSWLRFNVLLYWSEGKSKRDISSQWVYTETNLMLTLSCDKDEKKKKFAFALAQCKWAFIVCTRHKVAMLSTKECYRVLTRRTVTEVGLSVVPDFTRTTVATRVGRARWTGQRHLTRGSGELWRAFTDKLGVSRTGKYNYTPCAIPTWSGWNVR